MLNKVKKTALRIICKISLYFLLNFWSDFLIKNPFKINEKIVIEQCFRKKGSKIDPKNHSNNLTL